MRVNGTVRTPLTKPVKKREFLEISIYSKRARKIPEKTQAFSKEDIAQSAPMQPTEQAEPSGETEDASVEDLKDQEIKEPSEDTN